MTKELLQKRIDELEQRRLSLLADINAVYGAILDCKYWLSLLDQPEKKDGVQTEG